MNINIDLIVKVIIPILGAIITYILVPLIKEKTTKEQRENAYSWVKIAVGAAEQMNEAGLITIPKKEYVVEFLVSKGINVDMNKLDAMIESAVNELNLVKSELNK